MTDEPAQPESKLEDRIDEFFTAAHAAQLEFDTQERALRMALDKALDVVTDDNGNVDSSLLDRDEFQQQYVDAVFTEITPFLKERMGAKEAKWDEAQVAAAMRGTYTLTREHITGTVRSRASAIGSNPYHIMEDNRNLLNFAKADIMGRPEKYLRDTDGPAVAATIGHSHDILGERLLKSDMAELLRAFKQYDGNIPLEMLRGKSYYVANRAGDGVTPQSRTVIMSGDPEYNSTAAQLEQRRRAAIQERIKDQ